MNTESLLRNHVLPYFGDRRLDSVVPTDIQGFVADLEEKGLSPSTIRLAYLIVAGLFSSALDSDLIARTPCRGIKLPPRAQTEMRFLNAEQVAQVAGAIDAPYRALVLTAAYTGCRFGELAGMRVRRLELLRRSLTVAETLSDVRGHVAFAPPKTAAARRQVALPRFLLGHSSIQVTLDTYGHLFEGLDEAAADRLDAASLRTPADFSRTLGDSGVSELPYP